MGAVSNDHRRLSRQMLTGFTPPYTPSGISSLVPPPPWHYAGHILSIAFKVDRTIAQNLLPDGFGIATGEAAGHFCEWQATTDGSELEDPIYAQYKEFFVLIEVTRRGAPAGYCPFIYVDQDIAMARGWLQGWPKKIGSVWITRSYDLDHPAAAQIRQNARFGASLSVKDRRIADATIQLTGKTGKPIGFLAMPCFGMMGHPTLVDTPNPGNREIVRAVVSAKLQGPTHDASGTLSFFESPRDELAVLRPEAVTAASLSTLALTVTGAAAA